MPGNRWDLGRDDAAPGRSVSVVVAHFEQPEQLARTLAALHRQTRPPAQVVVADDGSARPPDVGPGVELVRQADHGFRAGAARNLGADHATGDLLVFLDADTAPEPRFLEQLTRLPARMPELLAVGRRRHADLTAADGCADAATSGGFRVEVAGPRHELAEPAWLRRGYADTGNLRRADATGHRFVISSVLACTRWWFAELGGFDEGFVGYGGEDWELAARSWRRGGLVAHVPEAVAWHDGPAAGEAGRGPTSPDDQLVETLALADRVGAPGAGFRGLLRGPADLLVTVDPGLGRRGLTVTLDSLLAALPRAQVALTSSSAAWFTGDPRITTTELEPASGSGSGSVEAVSGGDHRVHLHLTVAVRGSTQEWGRVAALADGLDPPATQVLALDDGRRVGVLHDLRQHRRARRWALTGADAAAGLLTTGTAPVALQAADAMSLQGWLEGWA